MDDTLRSAARDFYRLALAEAQRREMLSKRTGTGHWNRTSGPWPPYWECWEIARSAIAEPFVAALSPRRKDALHW